MWSIMILWVGKCCIVRHIRWHTPTPISTHPINTPYRHTLSTHPINTSSYDNRLNCSTRVVSQSIHSSNKSSINVLNYLLTISIPPTSPFVPYRLGSQRCLCMVQRTVLGIVWVYYGLPRNPWHQIPPTCSESCTIFDDTSSYAHWQGEWESEWERVCVWERERVSVCVRMTFRC